MKKNTQTKTQYTAAQLLSILRITFAMLVILLIIGIATNSDNVIRLAYALACLSFPIVFSFWIRLSDGTVTKRKKN